MGVGDLNDDMMTQHDKVGAAMIYHHLLMIFTLIVTPLAGTNISIIAGLSLSLRWAV